MTENQQIAIMTEIMREADKAFEKIGGGTRHYVRDLLIPMMKERGLCIVHLETKDERDIFAMSFLVFALYDPRAKELIKLKGGTRAILDLYENRTYLDQNPSNQ